MKRAIFLGLCLVNIFLGAGLARKGIWRTHARASEAAEIPAAVAAEKMPLSKNVLDNDPAPIPPPTPYATVYSSRPADFAANLRRVGCPEETVKDILFAEIGRRYHTRENQLRPKPADHVPFMWSPKTSEAKLIERRQEAAEIGREKADALRAALGYDVTVPMPLYAMTVSDQRFQEELNSIPEQKRQAAHAAQEQYWLMVEQLRSRTHGFWEPEDVQELKQLKQQRREMLDNFKGGGQQ
jgi:hypothetical protein